jgi:hypothetical protein
MTRGPLPVRTWEQDHAVIVIERGQQVAARTGGRA